jgi:integrase
VKFERESDQNVGKAITEEEEARLLSVCESNLLLGTVVSLALNTALRKNEIRTLRWSQIDLLERTLTVGRTKTEIGSGRVIPLNSVAYAALIRWAGRFPEAKPQEYVFPACENARLDCERPDADNIEPSRPIKSWRTAWRRALKDAGLKIRFHDLRHTCITNASRGPGERADSDVNFRTSEPQNAGILLAHPDGSEASGPGRHRKTRF